MPCKEQLEGDFRLKAAFQGSVCSIRVLQKKIIGDPYYEPTIVVHDTDC